MRSKTTGYKKMTRQYTIADHLIEVTAPEDAALWEVCTNYTPFELKPGNGAEPCDGPKPSNGAEQKGMAEPSPLCSLQIVDELEVPETEPFYEVKQEGYPRLSFSRLDGGWAVRMATDVNRPVLGVLMAAEDFRSARLKLLSGSARAIHFAVDNALMLMFALASARLTRWKYTRQSRSATAPVTRSSARAAPARAPTAASGGNISPGAPCSTTTTPLSASRTGRPGSTVPHGAARPRATRWRAPRSRR